MGEGATPPGALIWRLPGFIRPRRTARATHRFVRSYQWIELHTNSLLARAFPQPKSCSARNAGSATKPEHDITGSRGYLGKCESLSESSHKKKTEPRADSMRRAC